MPYTSKTFEQKAREVIDAEINNAQVMKDGSTTIDTVRFYDGKLTALRQIKKALNL